MSKAKTVKLARVRKLIALVDEGSLSDDGANALSELGHIIENLMKTARDVVNVWEVGDLADAVNALAAQLEYAERG